MSDGLSRSIQIIFFVTMITSSRDIFGQTSSWSRLRGPYAGNITLLTVDRLGNCYVATQFNGVYRSTDGGENWEQANNGLNWPNLTALAVDSSRVVYAGGEFSGLYKTTNQGMSWTRTGLKGSAVTAQVFQDQRLCVGGEDTVSISADGGKTWSSSQVLPGTVSPNVLSVTEDNAGNIYAGLVIVNKAQYGGGVYISTDSGTTWKSYGMSFTSVLSIVTSKSGKVFILVPSGILSAATKDSNWTRDVVGLPNAGISELFTDQAGEAVVATILGLYVYQNSGNYWENVLPGLSSVTVTAASYNPNGISYIVTQHDGVFSLSSAIPGWVQCGIFPASVVSLGVDQSGSLYAGTSDGIYEPGVIDGTWIRASNGLNSGTVYQIQPSAFRPRMYAATSGGLFYSADSGRSWNGSYAGWTYGLIELSSANMLVASTGGVVASMDGGADWSIPENIALPNANIYALATDGYGTIYAGTGNDGVFRTTDSGIFWIETGLTSPIMFCTVKSLEIDRSGRIFAGTDSSGAYYSDDEGIDWIPIASINSSNVSCFFVNCASRYFAGTLGRGVFISADGGQSWKAVNDGLADSSVASLVIDPKGYLYAATDSGIFRTVSMVTGVSEPQAPPRSISLEQNYPNPFNPSTVISYQLPVNSFVTLKVYDVLGREVRTLVDEVKKAGKYEVKFNASDLASGVYFYRLVTGDYIETKKMVLIK